MHSRDRRDRSTRDDENRVKGEHRLAGSAGGTGRSIGNLLDEAIEALAVDVPVELGGALSLTDAAHEYRERTERALALEHAALEYADAVHETSVIRRRIVREQDAQRRREERADRKDMRRPSRPVKVEVDPAAWETVRREAIRRHRTVGAMVGSLVLRVLEDGVVPRLNPQRDPQRRFARVFVSEESWSEFGVLAVDTRLSIGRFVGLLVEREAHRLELRGDR
jgi:hypothetical protein